jgi:hypothetical protein
VIGTSSTIKWSCPEGYIIPTAIASNLPSDGAEISITNTSASDIDVIGAIAGDNAGDSNFSVGPDLTVLTSNNPTPIGNNFANGTTGLSNMICIKSADDESIS